MIKQALGVKGSFQSAFFFIGLFFICNLIVFDSGALVLRFLDLFSFVFVLFSAFFFLYFKVKLCAYKTYLFFLVLLLLSLLVMAIKNDVSGFFTTSRNLLYITVSFFLACYFYNNKDLQESFSLGMLMGSVLLLTILLFQYLGVEFANNLKPIMARQWWVAGKERFTAVYEHPNGVSHIALLGIVVLFSLFKLKSRYIYLVVGIFLGVGLYIFTQTRSALIILIMLAFFSFTSTARPQNQLFIFFSLLVIGLLLSNVIENAFSERWAGDGIVSLNDNLFERFSTQLTSLTYGITSPFGLGWSGKESVLVELYGINATHNSFISMIMTYGVFFGLSFFYFLTCSLFINLRSRNFTLFSLSITSLYFSFFFEDVINSPNILALAFLFIFSSTSMVKGKAD